MRQMTKRSLGILLTAVMLWQPLSALGEGEMVLLDDRDDEGMIVEEIDVYETVGGGTARTFDVDGEEEEEASEELPLEEEEPEPAVWTVTVEEEPEPTQLPETPAPTLTPEPAPKPTPTPKHTATPVPRIGDTSAVLRPGDVSEDVRSMQTRLAELGYYTGDITGRYGELTADAVRAFQDMAPESIQVDLADCRGIVLIYLLFGIQFAVFIDNRII